MVDTRDLKSLGQQCPCGFDSRPRHREGWRKPSLSVLYPSPRLYFRKTKKTAIIRQRKAAM